MNLRYFSRILGILFGILWGSITAYADFTLYSQNTLHFGYGSSKVGTTYKAAKYKYLAKNIVKGTDVVLFQEVMKKTDPVLAISEDGTNKIANYVTYPTGATQNNWPNLKGFNRYKEAYMTAVNSANIAFYCYVSLSNANIGGATPFIRPPDMILLGKKGGGQKTWLLNFHAIWGDNKNQRKAEATALQKFVTSIVAKTPPKTMPGTKSGACAETTKVDRWVIGGDWNLSEPELKAIFTTASHIGPSTDTSLTPDGNLSNSYDHFILSPTVAYSVTPTAFSPGAGQPACKASMQPAAPGPNAGFRCNISDHLGVKVTIKE